MATARSILWLCFLTLTGPLCAHAQQPQVFEQPGAQAVQLEVIRPIADSIEPGKLARLKTIGPTKWTVYEPADLQVVVESDRSLLFAAPILPSRVVVFASVEVDGPDIFQPFIIHVRGEVPPTPVPPTPTPPTPTPPTPTPPVPPIPDDIPNQLGLGRNAYQQALAVNSPTRATEAKQIATTFRMAAATTNTGTAKIDEIWKNLVTQIRSGMGANRASWSTWETNVFTALRSWYEAKQPVGMTTWNSAFTELAAAMERVP
ncbi:MAG: hypothetical protein U0795_27000 [Pirellulales bacterium]